MSELRSKEERKLVRIFLRGDYAPADYFNEDYEQNTSLTTIRFSRGIVEATFLRLEPKPTPEDIKLAQEQVSRILMGRQLQCRMIYQFKGLAHIELFDDNSRNVHVSVSVKCHFGISAKANIVFASSSNATEVDPIELRRSEEKRFLEQIIRYQCDDLLNRLLASYQNALSDESNMMVYLYEMKDALKSTWGDEHAARIALGISRQVWSNFGKIANHEPIKEGRHRGNHSNLRPATEDERQVALDFGKMIVDNYLSWLDQDK